MPTNWSFFTAGQLVFGPKAVDQLVGFAAHHQLQRLLVITDARLRAAGVVAPIEKALQGASLPYQVF